MQRWRGWRLRQWAPPRPPGKQLQLGATTAPKVVTDERQLNVRLPTVWSLVFITVFVSA